MSRKVFKIGNSLAVTIPSQVQIEVGQELEFEKQDNRLIYILPQETANITSHVEKTSGSLKPKLPPAVIEQLIKELTEERQNEILKDFLRL